MAEETSFQWGENVPGEAYKVPPLTLRPNSESLEYNNQDTYKFIVLDLETAGLERTAEICQIAAIGSDTEDGMWLTYILPESDIDLFATVVHGLSITYINDERRLMKHDNPVEASSPKDGLSSFLTYLKTHANCGVKIVLISHNGKQFDSRILCSNFNQHGIAPEKLEELGVVFSDSLPLVRELRRQLYPPLLVEGEPIQSVSLAALYHHVFKEEFQAHDAGSDAQALQRLLFHSSLGITPRRILAHSFTVLSAWKLNIFLNRSRKLLQTMTGTLYHPYCKEQSVVTCSMAKKIAESGLGYSDLQQIYTMQGRDGITTVFKSPRPLDGGRQRPQARVTYMTRIIEAVIAHFESPSVSDSERPSVQPSSHSPTAGKVF